MALTHRLYMAAAGVLLLLAAAMAPAAARTAWTEFRSGNFVIYSNAQPARARALIENLESFRLFLRLATNVDSTSGSLPLTVFAFRDARSFQKFAGTPGVAGFYVDTLDGAAAFAEVPKAKGPQQAQGRLNLFHEYVHYYLRQFSGFHYPMWFDEGFAEYLSTFAMKDGVATVGLPAPQRVGALRDDTWASLDVLFSANAGYISGQRLGFHPTTFYAESWLVVHYLESDRERRRALRRYLAALNRGVPYLEAYKASFATPIDRMFKDVKAYWKSKRLPYLQYDLTKLKFAPQVSVRKLEAKESPLVLARANAFLAGQNLYRNHMRAKIKKILKRNKSALAPRLLLARIEITQDNLRRAQGVVATLEAMAPDDPKVQAVAGALRVKQAAGAKDPTSRVALMAKGRGLLQAAVAANPRDVWALYHLGYSYLDADQAMARMGLVPLARARALLPQNEDIRLTYARLAARAGRVEEARTALKELAKWSRSKDMETQAKAVLFLLPKGPKAGMNAPKSP